MIAKLAGIVDHVGPDGAIIDVGGVGYLAFCSTGRSDNCRPSALRRAS